VKRRHYPSITDREIVFAILHGARRRDARREGVLSSTVQVPPSGRRLRVVYRVLCPKKYMVITAFWLDK
jgi:hypothetical protein